MDERCDEGSPSLLSPLSSSGSIPLARPRSHIFRSQLPLTRRLEGLRSRWRTLAECRYLRPRRIW